MKRLKKCIGTTKNKPFSFMVGCIMFFYVKIQGSSSIFTLHICEAQAQFIFSMLQARRIKGMFLENCGSGMDSWANFWTRTRICIDMGRWSMYTFGIPFLLRLEQGFSISLVRPENSKSWHIIRENLQL